MAATIVISAAGCGSRLGHNLPKSLVEVAGKPILAWQLTRLCRTDDRVRIVVGYKGEQVAALAKKHFPKIEILYNERWQTTKTAASLSLGAAGLTGRCLSLDGDLLVHPDDFRRLVDSPSDMIGTTEVSSTHPVYAVVDDDGLCHELTYTVVTPHEWTGLVNFRPSEVPGNTGNVFEMIDCLLPVRATRVRCAEVDTPADLLLAEQRWPGYVGSATSPEPALDKERIFKFWEARTSISVARVATSWRADDRLQLDAAFVGEHLGKTRARILDLGAGTCTLAAALLDRAEQIVAVDKFSGFLQHAPADRRLRTVSADVTEFATDEQFDAILLFGVANYLSVREEQALYERCHQMLAAGGTFIVKNQCGVDQDVVVDRYSEDLACHYHARYPHVDSQRERLQRHFHVTTVDVYPPRLNRWQDTHFYGFVCRHRAEQAYRAA